MLVCEEEGRRYEEANIWYGSKISGIKMRGLRWAAVPRELCFLEGGRRVGDRKGGEENRELTFELGKGGRCRGIDQSECQVLQGGVKVSVDLQH